MSFHQRHVSHQTLTAFRGKPVQVQTGRHGPAGTVPAVPLDPDFVFLSQLESQVFPLGNF